MSNLARSENHLRSCGTLAVLGLVTLIGRATFAQDIPTAPPIPTAIPAAAPAAPTGFIGKCTSCVSSIGGCFKGCCNTPLGKLINGAFQPLEMATGGVIPAPCPGPNDPSKHGAGAGGSSAGGPPGPQQAAQAIKKDQAQAKARAEAVKYLATVPCHYYPEAEAALIQALRTDRSECVRWEAAHALAQGCCCTKKTIEALKIVASGSQKDGNPSEKSFRVKVEALNALEHCLVMCGDAAMPQRPEVPSPMPQPETIPTPLPQPKRPEMPVSQGNATDPTPAVQQVNYYEEMEKQSDATVLAEARRLVASSRRSTKRVTAPRRGNSLMELWRRSDRSEEVAAAGAEEAAGPVPVGLPDDAAAGTFGQPTLAPPQPPTVDMAAGHGAFTVPAPVARPYANHVIPPIPYPDASAATNWGGAPSPELTRVPQTAPSAYGPPSPSLPHYPQTESLRPAASQIQALPPLEALPQFSASPGMTATTMPGQSSSRTGMQGYLYPSTDARLNNHRQPAHVVQQPNWANPQPRR